MSIGNVPSLTHANRHAPGGPDDISGAYRLLGQNVQAPAFAYDGTDQQAKLQSAINAIAAGGGSGVVLIDGPVSFATPLDLTALTGAVTFLGTSPAGRAGGQAAAGLTYTGTGSSAAINATGLSGIVFQNLLITYTQSGFTGSVLDLSGTASSDGSLHKLIDCVLRPTGTLDSHHAIVNLDRTHSIEIQNCAGFGNRIIYGKASNSTYSNRVLIAGGFYQGLTAAPFMNADQAWKFVSVTVEATSTGLLAACLDYDAGVTGRSVTFDNCYMADDTSSGTAGSWIKYAGGSIAITGSGGIYTMNMAGTALIKAIGSIDSVTISDGVRLGGATNAAGYILDLTAGAGSGPVSIGLMDWGGWQPAAVVNGTIPDASDVQTQHSGPRNHYSSASARTHYGDVTSRYVDVYQAVTDTGYRRRDRTDGLIEWGYGNSNSGPYIALVGSYPGFAGGSLQIAQGSLGVTRQTQTLTASGPLSVSLGASTIHDLTLQANCTGLTITSPVQGFLLTVSFIQDATGGRTYAWPANSKFAGNAAPTDTTANTRTTVTFTYDGTNWCEVSRAVAVPI